MMTLVQFLHTAHVWLQRASSDSGVLARTLDEIECQFPDCSRLSLKKEDPIAISHEARALIDEMVSILHGHYESKKNRQRLSRCQVKVLRIWRRSLRLNFRERREAAIKEYLSFVSSLCLCGIHSLGFRLETVAFALCVQVQSWKRRLWEQFQMHRLRCWVRHVRHRILRTSDSRKVRVLFHVTDISKWKCQSVYDLMAASTVFEPFVLIDLSQEEYERDRKTRLALYVDRRTWFLEKGVHCLDGYDCEDGREVPVASFAVDVFFYQQPWGIRKSLRPDRVGRFALTCYVPYYVSNYSAFDIECGLRFHRLLSYYFVMTKQQAKYYSEQMSSAPHVCTFLPVGHPALDAFQSSVALPAEKKERVVIYAPHWTLTVPSRQTFCHYGTFEWSGIPILRFAEKHPEIHWYFKPHPLLRQSLVESGFFSEEQAARYYRDWSKIGSVCLDAEYAPIFRSSMALITDCGSFLSEYAMTGNPIVHLLSSYNTLNPTEGLAELYSTYYGVRNAEEIGPTLVRLLVDGIDDRAAMRKDALRRTGLAGGGAGRIVNFLAESLLGVSLDQSGCNSSLRDASAGKGRWRLNPTGEAV